MIKNIIFDWSGVINDNLITVYNAAMIIFEKYGAQKISLEEFKREWEQPYMVFYNKYLPDLSKTEEDTAYKAAYKVAASQYSPKPYSHIKKTLQKFKNAGIKMVVISSDPSENLLSEIEEFHLQGLFTEVYGEIHDKVEVIHEVIKENQFDPEQTIFIGDTTHEIKVGKGASTKTAAVTWGFQNEDKLKSANPDYIIHNLKELESIILGKHF
jgi:phosphoglycolate phosphatase